MEDANISLMSNPRVSPLRGAERTGRTGRVKTAPGDAVPAVDNMPRRTHSGGTARRASPPPPEPRQPPGPPMHSDPRKSAPPTPTSPPVALSPPGRREHPRRLKEALSGASAGLLREAKRLSELALSVDAALERQTSSTQETQSMYDATAGSQPTPFTSDVSAVSDTLRDTLRSKADDLERDNYELRRERRNVKAGYVTLQQAVVQRASGALEELRSMRHALADDKKMVQDMKRSLQHMAGTDAVAAKVQQMVQGLVDAAYQQGFRDGRLDVEGKYVESERQRSDLHQRLQEMLGTVQVVLRLRPFLPHELREAGLSRSTSPTATPAHLRLSKKHSLGSLNLSAELLPRGNDTVTISKQSSYVAQNGYANTSQGTTASFTYDAVLSAEATQSDVFHEISSIPVSVLDGYTCCILAYGQTGSGKTHTMLGSNGIVTSVLFEIYDRMKQRETEGFYHYRLFVSLTEVYNDTVRDLLCDGQLVGGSGGAGQQASEYEIVDSDRDIAAVLMEGERQRSVGVSNLNVHSSRSHCAIQAKVEGRLLSPAEGRRGDISGQVCLVDLAGSERIPSSHNPTQTVLRETQHINRSLSALGDVIQALSNNASHIPYRNSRLTHHLAPCLCRNSKVVVVATASPAPSAQGETLCTLQFAARLKNVHLGAARQREATHSGRSLSRSNSMRSVRSSRASSAHDSGSTRTVYSSTTAGREAPSRDSDVRHSRGSVRCVRNRPSSRSGRSGRSRSAPNYQ